MKDGMLEFSDWPMFDLLMTDKELCREVIEIILDESIADIEYIVTEDDVRPTLTNHGVRLDAFVKTKNEIYDIEMQTTKREDLGRRMRYYQVTKSCPLVSLLSSACTIRLMKDFPCIRSM